MWAEGERLVESAERVVARAPRLKTKPLPDDWARGSLAVRRALRDHNANKLNAELIAAMARLPLLSRIRATVVLGWVLRSGPAEVRPVRELSNFLGIGWRSMERAKRDLRLRSFRQAGRWYWRWP